MDFELILFILFTGTLTIRAVSANAMGMSFMNVPNSDSYRLARRMGIETVMTHQARR